MSYCWFTPHSAVIFGLGCLTLAFSFSPSQAMQLPSTTTDGRNERNFRTFTQGLRKLGKHQTIDIVGHFEVKHKFPSATALQLQQQGD